MIKPLKAGTIICPVCKTHLYFHLFETMRLKELIEGKYVYDAYCPNRECNKNGQHIKILADNQKD